MCNFTNDINTNTNNNLTINMRLCTPYSRRRVLHAVNFTHFTHCINNTNNNLTVNMRLCPLQSVFAVMSVALAVAGGAAAGPLVGTLALAPVLPFLSLTYVDNLSRALPALVPGLDVPSEGDEDFNGGDDGSGGDDGGKEKDKLGDKGDGKDNDGVDVDDGDGGVSVLDGLLDMRVATFLRNAGVDGGGRWCKCDSNGITNICSCDVPCVF
jgi:hypothetical protein